MYKLLIVDDESSARYGLRDCISWDEYGIEVVNTADGGQDALNMIAEQKPNLVITDVKMPEMDGISLAENILELDNEIKIIFVSGYDDLDYLKSALRMDAIDYIFKPVNLNELDKVVKKVIHLVNEEQEKKKLFNQMNTQLIQSLPLLREKFLMTLIRDGVEDHDNIQNRLDLLDCQLPLNGSFCVIVISIDNHQSIFEQLKEKDKQLTSFAILNISQEIIDTNYIGYVFENRLGEFVSVLHFSASEEEEKLFEVIAKIKDTISSLLEISVTAGVGQVVHELNNVPHSYCTAGAAASQKLFLGKNRVITMDSLETAENKHFQLDYQKSEVFHSVIKAANEEQVVQMLDDFFVEMGTNRNMNISHCRNICLQLLLMSSNMLIQLDLYSKEISMDEQILWESIHKLETIEDMQAEFTTHLKKICTVIRQTRNKKSTNLIETIKHFIHNNYGKHLTIHDIANEVYLTHTYLCLLFKEATGETINEYLTRVRIEKAKDMLAQHGYKLYDICESVGYSDPSYFGKLFKKYTGLSPSEYRKKVL